jgi:hypothetical protein
MKRMCREQAQYRITDMDERKIFDDFPENRDFEFQFK